MSFIRTLLRNLLLRSNTSTQPTHPSITPCISPQDPREPNTLYVHMPALRPWGYPNASPFSSKLECFLRMAEIKYVVVWGMDLKMAPKGKVPFIEYNGKLLGDTEFIFKFLVEKYPDCQLTDEHLTPEEKAVALAFNRLACEHMVYTMGYARNYEYFDKTLEIYGYGASGWIKNMIVKNMRKASSKRFAAHGLTVHSRDEIYGIGNEDLKAISDFLGDKPFLMGDRPCQVDAALFGILSSTLWIPLEYPGKEYAYKECPNLHDYLVRIKERYFADTMEPWYMGARKWGSHRKRCCERYLRI
ncbi:hypothetical protein BC829DRAFT_266184 [Chytridium lagenaria]|nr:hypothetical protein BC829DRAFT_266184 [Chytridium lagenaria]